MAPLILRAMLLVLAATGCSRGPASDPAAAPPTAQVRVERAVIRSMRSTLDAYGTVDYATERQWTVDTLANVSVEQVFVAAGQAVRTGDALMRVRPTANAVLERSKPENDARAAQQELARVQRLFGQRLATNSDLTAARQNAANASDTLSAARRRIRDTGAWLVRADRDAVVASVDVGSGEIVGPDAPLARLADPRSLSVRVGVEPADIAQVAAGQPVEVRPVYRNDQVLHGRVSEVVGQVDSTTRLAQAIVQVSHTQGLLPGSTVRAVIEIGRRLAAVVVPRAAILRDGDTAYVFLARQGTARRVAVQTGSEDDGFVEVTRGVSPGDVVVVEGNYVLEDGMRITLQPNGGRAP